MIKVKATREGLVGALTASGYVVDRYVPFVALPSRAALGLWVRVTNPATGKSIRAVVLDVGPWNTADHAYVFQDATIPGFREDDQRALVSVKTIRPQAEQGHDASGRVTNKAGIDLSEKVWAALGYEDNGPCEWEFI